MNWNPTSASILASLAGSAVGDALGLPYENLSARRAARLLGSPDRFRFFFGYGMVSDDAEHASMAAAALAASGGDVARFRRGLARRLRWWLLTMPPGIGLATLKSIVRLWFGVRPERAGVWSAGNGPGMRAAVLGRAVPPERLFDFVAASSRLTHTDPKATLGAFCIAVASQCCAATPRPAIRTYVEAVERSLPADADRQEIVALLGEVAASVERGEETAAFARRWCRKPGRVSGYIYETMPVAIHAVFANDGFDAAVTAAIRCGGDTDSVASIVGGIVGLESDERLGRLIEFPYGRSWLRELSDAVVRFGPPPPFPLWRRLVRNTFMLAIVLAHVARRALPPY